MVFEESTFVLPAGPGKATTEVAEPAVQDPSKKPETVERSAPATVIKPPKIGATDMHAFHCRVHPGGWLHRRICEL